MMLIFSLLSFFSSPTFAMDMSVIDVRRNITLSDKDPVYKDFYINIGPGSGLKKNLVITAMRKITVRDAGGANAFGEILVPVGQLKVIAIYDKIAVTREFSLLSREDLPMLEQTGIMTGDQIDLKGAFIDTSKPKKESKVAEEPTPPKSGVVSSVATLIKTTLISPAEAANQKTTTPVTPTDGPSAMGTTTPTSAPVKNASESIPSEAPTQTQKPLGTAQSAPKPPSALDAKTSKPEKLEKVANSDNNGA